MSSVVVLAEGVGLAQALSSSNGCAVTETDPVVIIGWLFGYIMGEGLVRGGLVCAYMGMKY